MAKEDMKKVYKFVCKDCNNAFYAGYACAPSFKKDPTCPNCRKKKNEASMRQKLTSDENFTYRDLLCYLIKTSDEVLDSAVIIHVTGADGFRNIKRPKKNDIISAVLSTDQVVIPLK